MQKHSYVTIIRVESTVEADEGVAHVPKPAEMGRALEAALGVGSKTMTVTREGRGAALVGYRVDKVGVTRFFGRRSS